LLKAGLGDTGEVTVTVGPVSSSILGSLAESLGGATIPRVLLRDTDAGTDASPLVQPASTEMPSTSDRSSRLQLLGEIARGGMGAVLKGRDPDLGRDLAVKVLLERHHDQPDLVRRFIEEAQIGGQLQHPGIVPIYELGTFADRRPYFAMKLVKGRTLASLLAERNVGWARPSSAAAHQDSEGGSRSADPPYTSLPRFLSIFSSICQTMAYAHARGVIHRDLKPSNVMVGSFGEVQVMDWGLAKVLPRGGVVDDESAGKTKHEETIISTARSEDSDSDQSRAGSVLGTPAYMSPEQARGEVDVVDERTDVFALGSILCEILTGEPAFTGRSSGEIQRKAARGETSAALEGLTHSGADQELIDLARACLAAESDDRPRHAGEVAASIDLYTASVQERLRRAEIAQAEEKARAEEAQRTAIAAEARAKAERHARRVTVGLAASVLISAATIGGGWFYLEQQRSSHRAATERVVMAALDEAQLLRGRAKAAPVDDHSKWPAAIAAVNKAKALLSAGEVSVNVRTRVRDLVTTLEQENADAIHRAEELDKDRMFIVRLEKIVFDSLRRGSGNERDREKEVFLAVDGQFAQAFREMGIDVLSLDSDEAGKRIRARSNPQDITTFLDEWALLRARKYAWSDLDESVRDTERLISIARIVDPDPWRNFIRSAGNDGLHRAAADARTLEAQSANGLVLLARSLEPVEYGDDHDFDAVDKVLRTAWRKSPQNFWVNYELARNARVSGAVQSVPNPETIRFASVAVALRPDNPWAREALGDALASADGLRPSLRWSRVDASPLYWSEKVESHWLDAAVEQYSEAVRLLPEEAYLHGKLGRALIHTVDRQEEGIAEYRAALQTNPADCDLRAEFALNLMNIGKDKEAASILEAPVEWTSSMPRYMLLGHLFKKLGNRDKAFDAFRLSLVTESAEPYTNIGCLHDTGTPEKELVVFREFSRKRPDWPVMLRHIATHLGSHALNDEAVGILRDAVTLNSKDADTRVVLAEFLSQLGEYQESQTHFDEACRISPENGLVRLAYGRSLARQGKQAESLAEFREAIRLSPEDADTRQRLGTELALIGRHDEANREFRRAMTLDQRESRANGIAWLLATSADPKLRDGKAAVEFATRACELTEFKNPAYLDTLAAAHAEAGDFDAAVKVQSQAIELLKDEKEKEDYRTRLKLYQEKKPFHQPNEDEPS
jgi:serine/threonine-protein kinase